MEMLYFRFVWTDRTGKEEGFISTEGTFDGETLVLGDLSLPAAALVTVDNRGRWVLVAAVDPQGQEQNLFIRLTSGDADELKAALGHARA